MGVLRTVIPLGYVTRLTCKALGELGELGDIYELRELNRREPDSPDARNSPNHDSTRELNHRGLNVRLASTSCLTSRPGHQSDDDSKSRSVLLQRSHTLYKSIKRNNL